MSGNKFITFEWKYVKAEGLAVCIGGEHTNDEYQIVSLLMNKHIWIFFLHFDDYITEHKVMSPFMRLTGVNPSENTQILIREIICLQIWRKKIGLQDKDLQPPFSKYFSIQKIFKQGTHVHRTAQEIQRDAVKLT